MTSVIFNLLVKIFILTIFGFICKKQELSAIPYRVELTVF